MNLFWQDLAFWIGLNGCLERGSKGAYIAD